MENITVAHLKTKVAYQEITADYCCDCEVCKKQTRNKFSIKHHKLNAVKINYSELGTHKRFTWILSELGKYSLSQEVIIPTPDLVVFNKSRPQYLIQYIKDSIKYITSGDKLGLTEILKSYTKIVRNRKKEEKPGVKTGENIGKEIALLRYTVNNKENENLDETPEAEDGPLRILSEKEFFDFMYERAGSTTWRNVVYIQTIVKSRSGFGNIINKVYNSPGVARLEELKESMNTDNDEMLMYNDIDTYCEKICRRIDAFLHFCSNLELVNMKVEFTQDDLGKIWFTYATEVYVRHIEMPKQLSNEQGRLSEQEVAALNAELDERIPKCVGKLKFEEYSESMMKIYKSIKEKADIERVLKAKPIMYTDNDLIHRLQTKHMWIKNPEQAKKPNRKADLSFDPRNTARAKQRFDLMKSFSRNDDFFPTNYMKRKEWIFTPSPEPSFSNKSAYLLKH